MISYSFIYSSVLESEEKMLSDLATLLNENQILNPERYGFMLVVSEAFTNALLHGNQLIPSKNIYLHVEINKNQLSADIIDEGELGLKQIKAKKPSILNEPNGRGVDLIRHYATDATFTEAENGGTKVTVNMKIKLEKITY